MSKTFNSMSDFILRGETGDVFHEIGERSATTHVFQSSRVEHEEGKRNSVGDTVALFTEVRTTHYGKAELAGRPSYIYRSVEVEDQEAATVEGGNFITRVLSMGATAYRLGDDVPAKRFGKKRLMTLHREALEMGGYPTDGLEG